MKYKAKSLQDDEFLQEAYQQSIKASRLETARARVVQASKEWVKSPSVKNATALAYFVGILATEEEQGIL